MMGIGTIANMLFSGFLITSPLTSYLDTALSIRRKKSSAGFSMDVCGIMLVASFLRINFWIGDRFDTTLLIQSFVMVAVQCVLLHQCLTYRPIITKNRTASRRPLHLWEWNDSRTFWRSLAQFVLSLAVLQVLIGRSPYYVSFLGTIGLGIEATLPIPQFLKNNKNKSVEGIRLSMIASWVFGDMCKLIWFYYGGNSIGIQFKLCAFVQTFFDASIALQYYMWHRGSFIDDIPGGDLTNSQDIPALPV
ncbi:protein of unknown function [Taphrina deformans PYCC 5710]|uniref:PQ loop repeat protein n=1 Tax=Taphrina deformans (strain PYCC 5710 / ATCC 11124 / CBS 356.35 / IMI 108563 / JCM 9778 / NBRC 8474) TaxID=1097556 RepID=R4XDU2_TAPDE|nr:protein of unknown function [Taphrina deformans PYCC 5710]|eukprot:CCG83802.1 protein of unknown function [Taphrina deformans PYCC 5710]